MKPYFICFLLLLVANHKVVTGINQLCVLRGKSEKLFANVALDNQKERWALYVNVNGMTQPKLIAIWRFINTSTELDFNGNSNINMDRNRNIWVNDVGEEDEGNYSIKYIVDNSNGPQVTLAVFELTETEQLQGCQRDHPHFTKNYSAPTKETTSASVTNGSIPTTFHGKTSYTILSGENYSLEPSHMMTIILAIVGTILVIMLIAGIYWLCRQLYPDRFNLKCLSQRNGAATNSAELKQFIDLSLEDGSTVSKSSGDKCHDGQRQAQLQPPVWNCDELSRQLDDLNHQRSVAKEVGDDECHLTTQMQTPDWMCDQLTRKLDDLKKQLSDAKDIDESDEAQLKTPIWRCEELTKQLDNLKQRISVEKGSEVAENATLCKICFENPINMVCLPCGHQMTCKICAKEVSQCPVCKRSIKGFLETYYG